jgi:hypothetical protein
MRQARFFPTPNARKCNDCQRRTRKASSRLGRVRRTYGLSEEDYWALYKAQGGRCAICKQSRQGNLDVDHDHALEREYGPRRAVRGLVCARCNRWAIPGVAGDWSIALALAEYLRRPPAFAILGTWPVGTVVAHVSGSSTG